MQPALGVMISWLLTRAGQARKEYMEIDGGLMAREGKSAVMVAPLDTARCTCMHVGLGGAQGAPRYGDTDTHTVEYAP